MTELIDFLLHVDTYLLKIVSEYGRWIYGVLFAVVFAETGLIVTPFLPGDSLLFAAGAIAAHEFFERHGGKAIVLGRFMPIVRTFVPFVAGVAEMSYPAFAFYNMSGAALWVGLCLGAGYVFGNVPVVKENFSLVALGIVAVSLLPMVIEYVRYRARPSQP
jgi:membrane-associated protein